MSLYETQNKIGKAGAEIQLIGAYVFGGIFIIVGLILVINSLTSKCDDEEDDFDKQDCEIESQFNGGVGALLILLAIGGVIFAKWWERKTKENEGFAQISALGTEASLLGKVFGN